MKHQLRILAKLVGLAVVVAHLGLTLAFNLPDNPLRQRYAGVLDATIGTWFPQNWRLFAPQPASTDVSLVVGCIDGAKAARFAAAYQAGKDASWDGEWVDITAPLWTRHQEARLSAYDRISRAQANAGRAYLQGPAGLDGWWQACNNGETQICEQLDRVTLLYRTQQLQKMVRQASSYCKTTTDDAQAVALRIRERKAVPWSQRFDGVEPETADVDLGILPIDRTVEPAPIYASISR